MTAIFSVWCSCGSCSSTTAISALVAARKSCDRSRPWSEAGAPEPLTSFAPGEVLARLPRDALCQRPQRMDNLSRPCSDPALDVLGLRLTHRCPAWEQRGADQADQ